MFGFRKKNGAPPPHSALSDNQKRALAKGLSDFLSIQLGMAALFAPPTPSHVTQIEPVKGSLNKKAMGYIYGFVDAAVQNQGETIANVYVGPPVLFAVLGHLFPGHEARYMEFLADHEQDQAVMAGRLIGGQNFIDHIARRDNGSPAGLSRILTEHR